MTAPPMVSPTRPHNSSSLTPRPDAACPLGGLGRYHRALPLVGGRDPTLGRPTGRGDPVHAGLLPPHGPAGFLGTPSRAHRRHADFPDRGRGHGDRRLARSADGIRGGTQCRAPLALLWSPVRPECVSRGGYPRLRAVLRGGGRVRSLSGSAG